LGEAVDVKTLGAVVGAFEGFGGEFATIDVNDDYPHFATDTADGDGGYWGIAPIRSRPPIGVGVDGAGGFCHAVDADRSSNEIGDIAPVAVGVLFANGTDVEVVLGRIVEVGDCDGRGCDG